MPTYNLSYYPWITQHKTPDEIKQSIEVFSNALQQELQASSESAVNISISVLEVPDQINSIVQGQTQIALMNPLGFVYARKQNVDIDASVVALRIIDGKIGDSYFSQIYTHIDTGIKDLQGLRKHSMGFGSSQSTSNFIIPAFDLKHSAIHPLAAFKRVEFLGGHDKVAIAVYDKQIDGGAGHDGVIIDLSQQPGYNDAKDKLITIHRSDPIPSDPIALNILDKNEYMRIQSALVSISNKSPAKEAIADFWGNAQGLKETTYQPYEYLINAVNELGLTLQDIFG